MGVALWCREPPTERSRRSGDPGGSDMLIYNLRAMSEFVREFVPEFGRKTRIDHPVGIFTWGDLDDLLFRSGPSDDGGS